METNETNKSLYEKAFIGDGEYTLYELSWKPSIDEREIQEWSGDNEGNYKPATPLGYRDYTESRIEGIRNILSKGESVDLMNDMFHNLRKEDWTIKKYDKIATDKGDFVVTGDEDDRYFIVDSENNLYYVAYSE